MGVAAVTVRLAAALALCGVGVAAAPVPAQLGDLQWAKIESCAAADSVLGPLRGDWAARVHGFYNASGDSSQLWAGSPYVSDDRSWWITALVHYHGRVRTDSARPALTVVLRSERWGDRLSGSRVADVVLVLDDSIRVEFAPPLRGEYRGPYRPLIPLSVNLTDLQFAGVARARKVTVLLSRDALVLSGDERRDLRGLYRLAVCRQVVAFTGPVSPDR